MKHGISLSAVFQHYPNILESDIRAALSKHCQVLKTPKVYIGDCSIPHCGNKGGIHVFLEFTQEERDAGDHELQDAVLLIQTEIQQRHSDFCHEVNIFGAGTFASYASASDKTLYSLQLQDDLSLRNIKTDFSIVQTVSRGVGQHDDPPVTCPACSHRAGANPLHWKELDIVQEWFYGLPL